MILNGENHKRCGGSQPLKSLLLLLAPGSSLTTRVRAWHYEGLVGSGRRRAVVTQQPNLDVSLMHIAGAHRYPGTARVCLRARGPGCINQLSHAAARAHCPYQATAHPLLGEDLDTRKVSRCPTQSSSAFSPTSPPPPPCRLPPAAHEQAKPMLPQGLCMCCPTA